MRNNSKVAPGAPVPAITASPARPMTATSKTGLVPSPLAGEGDGAADAGAGLRAVELSSPTLDAGATTAGAAVAALVSIGCSRNMCGMAKKTIAMPAATNASDGRAIRPIDVMVMDAQPLARLLACQHPLDDLASFHCGLIIARFAPSGILLNCDRCRNCEARISTKSAGSIAVPCVGRFRSTLKWPT